MNPIFHTPYPAEIIERTQEAPNIFTFKLRFKDSQLQKQFRFQPGQFNMVYHFGVGEVAISISSDPDDENTIHHTIRSVGRITNSLVKLNKGDYLGIRGPFGNGWPIEKAQGKDIIILTGGLGCAPVVGMINYIVNRRKQFGKLMILQGVKHSHDLIFRDRYNEWQQLPNTQVLLAADRSGPHWTWHTGYVTELISELNINPDKTICMICGPEMIIQVDIKNLLARGLDENNIFLSMERNMECAIGHCGHCQFGGSFICKDGPIFCYSSIKELLGKKGF